ncbi:glycosyltransferase family 2 protein [Aureitalea marina]|uniref:Glycosyl transferase family 2 n=1 Tax=Aureitalea marina TaxID=930804 RepID=A0A2S7KQS7_9FLAO|nr:glycosyltransferase family A protein [Aureitalea marina]PQB04976.1 glycosyl transferase family 2 [Aureitalea marina]
MRFAIIIPAYNEESNLPKTLQSLVEQSLLPTQLIVVNDNSTDDTFKIASDFSQTHHFIKVIDRMSEAVSLPGAKVIETFYAGLEHIDHEFDVICKFDADLSFPSNYLESLANEFKTEPSLGMVGGFCEVEKDGKWVLEDLTGKDHIRGALKAYRKACFDDIGGLKKAMGWDTIDEQLARYYGWKVKTLDHLRVKHWKPTGSTYKSKNGRLQGEAFKRMRFGFTLSLIGLTKLALKKKSLKYWFEGLSGYLNCKEEALVTPDQGTFIRKWRWQKIKKKLF